MKDALYDTAMRNADRYEALAERAESGSDGERAGFFRRMRDENRRNAEEVERILTQRVAE